MRFGFKKTVSYLLFVGLFVGGFFYFRSHPPILKLPSLEEIGSKEWVQQKRDIYPELEWLLDKSVQQTQEGKGEQVDRSWSKQLTGQHYPEFERTMLSMVCLYLILDGSSQAYERFTMLQSADDKLTQTSFKRLHDFALQVVHNDPERLHALEINLLLGDMGKTQQARLEAKNYGISEPDADIFLKMCLEKAPAIFPTFMSLPPQMQEMIKTVTGLVHFGHVTHVEGGPEMLTPLKQAGIFQRNSRDFDFEILTHLCDVSAARGHEDNRGSKVLTENVFKALEAVKEALHQLAHHDEKEALTHYLTTRAVWLGLEGDEKFVLTRVGTMIRLYSLEEGVALKKAYAVLTEDQKATLKTQLDPLVIRQERTATYIPALLVNFVSAQTKQGLSKLQAIEACVRKGVVFIADVLQLYRNGKANLPYNPELTLNFNKAAGQVRDNPNLLSKFKIDPQGSMEIVS